jgi:hypothetical protein
MTKEQKQQLLQDMLEGKAQPSTPVQAFLVGQVSKLRGQLAEHNQALGQLRQQAASVEVHCQRLAGAHDEHLGCLASLLGCGVDDPPMPGPPDAPVPPRDWFDNGRGSSNVPPTADAPSSSAVAPATEAPTQQQ